MKHGDRLDFEMIIIKQWNMNQGLSGMNKDSQRTKMNDH